ncbi:MAG: 3-deoxy-manno-octulosonate cytidylyltransferase [Saprospiraceae bacterium]|nr:3-deoxy-manno-octulosonate cytidylyltransferase [Saprospiraceae bacterium]
MQFLGVIPARYKSSRFPGKPLALIGGTSMIERVYNQAHSSKMLSRVLVATDDQTIYEHCMNAKMEVVMTSESHQSGTDRVAEVAKTTEADVIVNIQGDEPFIPSLNIDLLCRQFVDSDVLIGTLLCPITNRHELRQPHIVKAVRRADGRALYFSRAPIPFQQNDDFDIPIYRHLGIYAFTKTVLLEVANLERGLLEQFESLEQLRWLEAGYDIMTSVVPEAPIGVDLPGDIDKLHRWMEAGGLS